LPKFGAWDVKDPNAGDGFTMIFQKLSNEKKEGGPVHIPRLNSDQPPAHEDSYGNQPVAQRNNNHQPKSHPVSMGSYVLWLSRCSELYARNCLSIVAPCATCQFSSLFSMPCMFVVCAGGVPV